LVRSLVSDPEAVAAKNLEKVLGKIRAVTPQIDTNAIAALAASRARQEIAVEDNQRALSVGLSKFTSSYPDIAADPDLFALADRKTNAIAEEHPEWTPEQVMLEAGRVTREWVTGISGRPRNPTLQNNTLQDRQQRKQNLKPMPQSRTARPAPVEPIDDSAAAAVAEMRKARGQAY